MLRRNIIRVWWERRSNRREGKRPVRFRLHLHGNEQNMRSQKRQTRSRNSLLSSHHKKPERRNKNNCARFIICRRRKSHHFQPLICEFSYLRFAFFCLLLPRNHIAEAHSMCFTSSSCCCGREEWRKRRENRITRVRERKKRRQKRSGNEKLLNQLLRMKLLAISEHTKTGEL